MLKKFVMDKCLFFLKPNKLVVLTGTHNSELQDDITLVK